MSSAQCYNCNHLIEDFGRADTCPSCRRDTRVCRNCEFYDSNYNNECRESQADRVVEKEKSNFCDYFKPGSREGGSGPSSDDLKSAAEKLFKF